MPLPKGKNAAEDKEIFEKEYAKLTKDFVAVSSERRELGLKVMKLETELSSLKAAHFQTQRDMVQVRGDLDKKNQQLQMNASLNASHHSR